MVSTLLLEPTHHLDSAEIGTNTGLVTLRNCRVTIESNFLIVFTPKMKPDDKTRMQWYNLDTVHHIRGLEPL